jgi:nucleoside-diphosphate-sugar epimerase
MERLREPLRFLKSHFQRNRQGVRREVLPLRWKEASLRVAADLVLTNGSMLGAAVIWAIFKPTFFSENPGAIRLITSGKTSLSTYVLLWSVLSITIFYFHGFYTRTRGYVSRYKAWVIGRAVSLVIAVFIVIDHFFLLGGFSRAVAVLGWLLMLLSVGGVRLGKDLVISTYRIEPRLPASSKVKRVLVLGGAGYLGSALMPKLLEKGYKVRLLDSFVYGDGSIARIRSHPDFEVFKGDVREIHSVVDAMRDCEAVIDLAAIVGDPACDENRRLAVEINRAATRMLIDIARGCGVRRFLFASSCSVYGASQFLMDEFSAPSPISTYAQTKVDSEKLLLEVASRDFHPTILRLGTLFGLSPRPRFDLVVNLLTARAAATGKITVFNGQQWRPFLHVRDAARAFMLCMEAEPAVVAGEIFNVGDYNLNHRLADVSKLVASIVPHVEISHVDNGDQRNYRVSFDKIHSRLGFRTEITLEEGIRELYEWIKPNHTIDLSAAPEFNNQAMIREFAQSAAAQQSTLRMLQSLAECA